MTEANDGVNIFNNISSDHEVCAMYYSEVCITEISEQLSRVDQSD